MRIRTADPLRARQVLYQLSYIPAAPAIPALKITFASYHGTLSSASAVIRISAYSHPESLTRITYWGIVTVAEKPPSSTLANVSAPP